MAEQSTQSKTYKLLGPDRKVYESEVPGTLGGNLSTKIYGRLDCPTALRWIKKNNVYAQFRVFFADEPTAIAAGYRPCAHCLPEKYKEWKEAQRKG
jgi:Metal binding domain of Ada